jgi:hypothetical protein
MMISISLIIVGLLGVFSLLTRSYAMQQPLIDQYTATYLAAEGIEVTKNFIDHNIIQSVAWNTGLQVDGDYGIDPIAYTLDPMLADRYLKLDPDTGLYTYQMGDNTKFKRVITVENISADELRITSRVVWNDKKGRSQEVVLEDHFFNWR